MQILFGEQLLVNTPGKPTSFLKLWSHTLRQAFFLTPPAEKTKTQGQNSSKKLKEKTQPLGGLSLPYAKLKKKTKIYKKFLCKTQNFQRGGTFYTIFINKYFQK